jgi:hypothetical protein
VDNKDRNKCAEEVLYPPLSSTAIITNGWSSFEASFGATVVFGSARHEHLENTLSAMKLALIVFSQDAHETMFLKKSDFGHSQVRARSRGREP